MKTKAYITSKAEEALESCQDAYEVNKDLYRYAVADGATREYFSAKLAQELVCRFCFDNDEINRNILNNEKYEEWLEPIQKKWLTYVKNIIENREVNFVVKKKFNKQDSGASTFVGLELNVESCTFKAMIIGDSCLFHIRDNEIIKSYLIDDYRAFDNSPDFFFSRDFILNEKNMIEKREFTKPNIVDGSFQEGDYFLLATDAISKWFLIQQEKGKWKELWNGLLKEDKDWYDKLIEENRQNRENKIDDDDVTILIVSTNDSDKLIPFSKSKNITLDVEEKKEAKNKDIFSEKEIKESLIIDDSKKLEKEEHQESKEEKSQPIFLIIYKKLATQESKVLHPYLKFKVEQKGFKFISQKKEIKINQEYQQGIVLLDYTSFLKIDEYDIGSKCFTYYKFSNKDLPDYKFDKRFNTYIKKIEDIYYDDIWKTNKISNILKEYKNVD